MSSSKPSWFPWPPNISWGFTKGKMSKEGRALREQIQSISGSTVLDDADIDDAQVLTLTREDLNELFPGIGNFQLRKTIMMLITEAVKDSGPETFAGALKHLIDKNNSNDAAVHDVLKESLRAFREMEEQLKATQASLKPYIEVLDSLTDVSARKQHWDTEGASSRRKAPSSPQTDFNSPAIKTPYQPPVKVHLLICGQTLGVDREILSLLNGVTVSDLRDCQLILVFCPIASRAGTDIEDALRKVPADKPAFLVIMHHTFNPDQVCPSFNMTSSQVNIVGQVNILFHDSQGGLLKCLANDLSITKLQRVLRQYM